MKPSRTYSGGRIRITNRQAALIEHLVTAALRPPISDRLTAFAYDLKDLRDKAAPHIQRHDTAVARLWATTAGVAHTRLDDVGHNAGMNTNLGQA